MFWRGSKIYRPYMRKLNALAQFKPDIMDRVYLEAARLMQLDEAGKKYPLKANGHTTSPQAREAKRQLALQSALNEWLYCSLAAQSILTKEGLL